MTRKLEEIARAICVESGQGWESASEDYREICAGFALAAVRAMREMTEEMEDAADEPFHEALKWHCEYNERAGISVVAYASAPFTQRMWPAMIDSILADTGESK